MMTITIPSWAFYLWMLAYFLYAGIEIGKILVPYLQRRRIHRRMMASAGRFPPGLVPPEYGAPWTGPPVDHVEGPRDS